MIEWHPDDHSDTNPPFLKQFPAKSVTELLLHAFKRMEVTLIAAHREFPVETELDF